MISLGGGVNLDLAHRTSDNIPSLLTDRKVAAPLIDIRLMHLFAPKWGWYFSFVYKWVDKRQNEKIENQYALFKDKYYIESYDWGPNDINSTIHGDVGVVYRIEKGKWALYPRIGIGVNDQYGHDIHSYLKEKGNNKLYEINFGPSEEESFETVNLAFGLNANYKISKKFKLFLDISYLQPFTSITGEFCMKDQFTKEIVEYKSGSNSTLGRELNISMGVSLSLYYKNKKKKQKTIQKVIMLKEQ